MRNSTNKDQIRLHQTVILGAVLRSKGPERMTAKRLIQGKEVGAEGRAEVEIEIEAIGEEMIVVVEAEKGRGIRKIRRMIKRRRTRSIGRRAGNQWRERKRGRSRPG